MVERAQKHFKKFRYLHHFSCKHFIFVQNVLHLSEVSNKGPDHKIVQRDVLRQQRGGWVGSENGNFC